MGVVAALAVGAGVAAALVASSGSSPSQPSSQAGAPFPVAQHSTATASGVQLALNSAQFSGTATMLALTVTPQNPPASDVRAITIPMSAFGAGTLHPMGNPLGGAVGTQQSARLIARMTPVDGPGAPTVDITMIDVAMKDGTNRQVAGNWVVTVSPPSNIDALLKKEVLTAGTGASVEGVTASIASAVRSETETLVTIHVAGTPGVQFLGIPTLTVSGKQYQGRLLSAPAGFENLTYSFPPTAFGASATLGLSGAVKPVNTTGGYVDVNLGEAMSRDGLTGKAGEEGVLLDSDVVSENVASLTPTELQFVDAGAQGTGVRITLGTPLTPGQFGGSRPELTLPDGSTVGASGVGTGYNHDASGAITSGQSMVTFLVDPSRVRGVVRISVGSQQEVLPGTWSIGLQP